MDSVLISVFTTLISKRGLTASTLSDVVAVSNAIDKTARFAEHSSLRVDAENYLLANVMKKNVGLIENASVPAMTAFKSWLCTESRNGYTNLRIQRYGLMSDCNMVNEILHRTKYNMKKYLGDAPDEADILRYADWPTGATAEKSRAKPVDKCLSKDSSCDEACLHLARQLIIAWDHTAGVVFSPLKLNVSSESVMDCVPKTYKTDRIIEKGPAVMVALQKGAGRYIRNRLKRRFGIDLNSQQDLNKEMARQAFSRSLSTIDLKEASDSITVECIKLLVHHDWFTLLDSLRTKFVRCPDGVTRENEKFSANGNGFTFELETVLFRSITDAATWYCGNADWTTVACYGDDIICAKEVTWPLIKTLEYLGFLVSKEKSFIDGYFRESCGGHYAFDHDVTPAYLKRDFLVLTDFIINYNKLFKWAQRNNNFAFVRKALLLIKNEAIKRFKLTERTIPLQPAFMHGDFGFLTDDRQCYRLNANGRITVKCGLIRTVDKVNVGNAWFYYMNVMRGGIAFYDFANSEGGTRDAPDLEQFSIRHNYTGWISSTSSVRPCNWLPSSGRASKTLTSTALRVVLGFS